MQVKLHFMGPLKQRLAAKVCPDKNCYLEISEHASPRELLHLLGVEDSNVLALVNGKPVDLEAKLNDGDRVVLMDPHSKEA
ncbi:MAG: MoaD/ThiS family protein [Clostridia bacterium]|jgi:sulfur carrier protein ThiS|nr:MoaD/ThiS family protein [Clostridia bacterium]